MAKNSPAEWDKTAANNTDVGGISIVGTAAVSNFDNALREAMAQIATQFGLVNVKGADIASAATVDLSAATGNAVDITGTTTITGLGTVAAGQMFILQFDGILTLTHGASIKLPDAVNITTAAGDIAVVISEGSGSWRLVSYQRYTAPIPTWEQVGLPVIIAGGEPFLSWTNLSAYRRLRLTGFLRPTGDGVYAAMRTSVDNGSNWDAGGSDYASQYVNVSSSTVTASAGAANAFYVNLTTTIGNASTEGIDFTVEIGEFNASNYCTFRSDCMFFDPTASLINVARNSGRRLSTTARNAFQLVFPTTTIAYGHATLMGMR